MKRPADALEETAQYMISALRDEIDRTQLIAARDRLLQRRDFEAGVSKHAKAKQPKKPK